MDTTRLTEEERAKLALYVEALTQEVAALRVKLAACKKQWAFAKSHDSELDHMARIKQLEAKLARAETSYDVMRHLGREYDKYQDAEPKGGA